MAEKGDVDETTADADLAPPQEAHPLFLSVGATEPNHDDILKHMAMDFVPYPYQRSLATFALKGMDPERRNFHVALPYARPSHPRP